jgi:hypothetical protein
MPTILGIWLNARIRQVSDLMSDRYGTDSPGRRRLLIALSGLVGVVELGWLAWAVWFQSNPDVQSSLRTFEVTDPHSVTASLEIRTSDKDVRANCLVRATGSDHSVVGELNFIVTGVKGTVHRDVTVRTEREATTVEMVGCTTKDQSRPR